MSEAPEAQAVRIPPHGLEGTLAVPAGAACGLVLFAHGSGSSRLSPRNAAVAAALRGAGLATLLFDLLSEAEAADRANIFDIPLLGGRLASATAWTRAEPRTNALPIGYFGASTGAAAALVAAARPDMTVGAVVSRGGRPDLAGDALPLVRAPTLLIVGGADTAVLALNRTAKRALRCESRLEIVPGATHLFEEPGAVEQVVALARNWFLRHLGSGDRSATWS
jgi:dienelactone hydrolase